MVLPTTSSGSWNSGQTQNLSLNRAQSSSPTDGAMSLEMRKLGELLSSLENVIAQFSQKNAENHNGVSNAYIQDGQEALQKAVQAYHKQAKENRAEAHEALWKKIGEGILAGVCCIAAVAAGQPELAAMVVAFTVMQMSGGMKDAKDGMAKLFQEAGCSPEVAHLLSDATIIAVTILITHGAGGLGSVGEELGLTTARTVETTATTATENVATEATEEVSTEATEEGSNTLLARAKNVVKSGGKKFKSIASKLSKRAAFNLAAGSQAFIGSGAGLDIAKGIFSTIHDKKTKEALEMTLMVVLDLMASVAAGAGISRLSTEGRNMGATISSIANKGRVMQMATLTGITATAGEVGVDTAQGFTNMALAHTVKELGTSKATLDIVQGLEQGADEEFSTILRGETSTLSALNKELGSMGHDWSRLGAAVSHCLELQA